MKIVQIQIKQADLFNDHHLIFALTDTGRLFIKDFQSISDPPIIYLDTISDGRTRGFPK